MVFPAERRAGVNPDSLDQKQPSQGLTHEDLVNLVGHNYQQLIFEPLKRLKIAHNISELEFKSPTGVHLNSDGNYIVEQIFGKHRVFAYRLGKGVRTSYHQHLVELNLSEHYFLLRGEMDLTVGGSVQRLDEKNNSTTVFPGNFHQGKSNADNTLVLVIMPDSSHIPYEQLHAPSE